MSQPNFQNMNKALDRFLEAQNRLVIQSSDLSLESIASMAREGAIDISPKYQRRERWSIDKQSALIESFLLNIPVPPIYLSEDQYGKYSVIDGKQRITSIFNFIEKGQKLKNLETFIEIEGFDFHSLPEQLKNALSIRPYLRVVTLLKQSDQDLKYEVFQRLNTGGEQLLPQEIRNVAFRGPYNDMIFELAKNDFLRQQLKIKNDSSKAFKKMVDAEYVLRFFTLRDQWDDFPGNMRVAMDNQMQKHKNAKDSKIKESKEIFNSSINLAKTVWGNNAFKRPDSNSYRNQMLQGVYDVQVIPFSLLNSGNQSKVDSKKKEIQYAFIEMFDNNEEFHNSIRQFTSNPDRVYTRISIMLDKLEEILG